MNQFVSIFLSLYISRMEGVLEEKDKLIQNLNDSNKKSSDIIEQLTKSKNSVEQELNCKIKHIRTESHTEVKESQEIIQELNKKLAFAEEELESAQSELESVQAELGSVQAELGSVQAELNSAKDKLAELEKEVAGRNCIEAELRKCKQELIDLKLEHEELKMLYNSEVFDNYEKEIRELKSKIEELEKANTRLRNEHEEELTATAKDLESKHFDQVDIFKKEIYKKDKIIFKATRKVKKNKDLEELIIKASKDLRTKDELITKWKEKSQKYESQFMELKKETDQKIEELENDMEKILQESKDERQAQKARTEEMTQRILNLEKDLEHYSDLYKTSETNCNTLCTEKISLLNNKISTQTQSINKAHMVIKKLNQENQNLVLQLEQTNNKVTAKDQEIGQTQKLENKLQETLTELNKLKKRIEIYEDTVEKYKKSEQESREEVQKIKGQMNCMQENFDSSYQDLEKAKEFNDNLNEELEKANTQISKLQDQISQLESEIGEKDKKFKTLEKEMDIREGEKEKIIDHIKKQAENAVAFYKNKVSHHSIRILKETYMSPEVPKFYTNPKVGMKYFKFTKNEKQPTQIKTKMNMNNQNMGINRSKYIKIFSKNAAAKMKRRHERRSLFDAMNHHRSQEIKEYQNSELLETVQEIQRQRQWQKENKQKRSESPSLKKNNSFNTFEIQKPPKSRVVYQRVKDIPSQLGVES